VGVPDNRRFIHSEQLGHTVPQVAGSALQAWGPVLHRMNRPSKKGLTWAIRADVIQDSSAIINARAEHITQHNFRIHARNRDGRTSDASNPEYLIHSIADRPAPAPLSQQVSPGQPPTVSFGARDYAPAGGLLIQLHYQQL
jgi:hypothetical protein